MRRWGAAPAAMLALAGLAGATPARAQDVEGALAAQRVGYRTRAAGAARQQTGWYLLASGALPLGRVHLGLAGMIGLLGSADSAAPETVARLTRVTLDVRPLEWLAVGSEAQARYVAVRGRTPVLLRLVGPSARTRADLGPGIEGTAELAYFPLAQAVNADPIGLALRSEVGVRVAPWGGRLAVQVAYSLLRIDYRLVAGAQRLEQETGLSVGIAVLRRRVALASFRPD